MMPPSGLSPAFCALPAIHLQADLVTIAYSVEDGDTPNRERLVEKNGFKSPMAGQGTVARPSLTRSSGLRKTCVQKTECSI